MAEPESVAAAAGESRLLRLPPEIREEIYRIILHPDANRTFRTDEYSDYNYRDALVLFRLNRQIYYEARRIFRELNVTVRVETPWPEADHHVAFEGHVPILMVHNHASKFTGHSLSVVIGTPETLMPSAVGWFFVILLDDLESFTKTWQYADLSNPGLNSYLNVTLKLRDPYAPDYEEKHMPKWLQRKLLLPFGMLKGLRKTTIMGDLKPFASLEAELRAEQEVPHRSPEACLAETARLKQLGNEELKSGHYHEALDFYHQAWEAMHVVVKGHKRHVHAEAFFAKELEEEPYRGKNGQMERLTLRVQLVANTCLAYLKLENWEEARFWGTRTITMMRQSIGADERDISPEDEAITGFPAAVQMGRIYYRTALAYKELGDKAEARKLLRVASVYLPHDPIVKREIAACALRLG